MGLKLGVDQIFNEALLRYAERDHTYGWPASTRGTHSPKDLRHNRLRLCAIGSGGPTVVKPIGYMAILHAKCVALMGRRRKGVQPPFIVVVIGKGDERFMAAAIMPPQRQLLKP